MQISKIIFLFICGLLTFTHAQNVINNKRTKEREKRTVGLVIGSIVKGLILKEAVLQFLNNATANITQNRNSMMQMQPQQQQQQPPANGRQQGGGQSQPSPPPPPQPQQPPSAAPQAPPSSRRPNGKRPASPPPPPAPEPSQQQPPSAPDQTGPDASNGNDASNDGGSNESGEDSTEDTTTGTEGEENDGDDEDNATTIAQDRLDSNDNNGVTTIESDIGNGPNNNLISSDFFNVEDERFNLNGNIQSQRFGNGNSGGPFINTNQFFSHQGHHHHPAHSYVKTNGYEFTNYHHGHDHFINEPERSFSSIKHHNFQNAYEPSYDNHNFGSFYYRKKK